MSIDRVYKPSPRSYQGSTAPLDPTRCHYDVWASRGAGSTHYQCTKKIWKDRWCKQHHPDSIAERARQAEERYRLRVLGPIHRAAAARECVDVAAQVVEAWNADHGNLGFDNERLDALMERLAAVVRRAGK